MKNILSLSLYILLTLFIFVNKSGAYRGFRANTNVGLLSGNLFSSQSSISAANNDPTIETPTNSGGNAVSSVWWRGQSGSASFDARQGFQLRFTYRQSPPYGSPTSNINTAASPRTLGFRTASRGIGVGLQWSGTQNPVLLTLATNDNMAGSSLNSSVLPIPYNEGGNHTVQLSYNPESQLLLTYHDSTLFQITSVNLTPFFSGNQFVGFTGEIDANSRETHTILTNLQTNVFWDFEAIDRTNDRLWISCPVLESFNAGLAEIVSSISPAGPRLQDSDIHKATGLGNGPENQLDFLQPGDVVAFIASRDAAGNFGCMVEVRQPENGYALNLNNLWVCSDTDPMDPGEAWRGFQPFNDPSFIPATNYGSNVINPPAPYRHLPNIGSRVERIWLGPSVNQVFCRAEVPAYCSPSNPLDMVNCVGNEVCLENLCVCPFPFTGTLCDTIQAAVLDAATPSAIQANTPTTVTLTGSNIFSNAMLACLFDNGMTTPGTVMSSDFNTVVCQVPSLPAGEYTVRIRNTPAAPLSNGASFTVFNPFTVTAISPDNGTIFPPTQVTISGSNFPTGAGLVWQCIFPPEPAVPATRIDSSTLRCTTGFHIPGVVSPFVSPNGGVLQVAVPGTYTFRDSSTSEFCRDFFANNMFEDFPFVTPLELNGIGPEGHLARNVAAGATFTHSPASPISAAQLGDNDYCCEITAASSGTNCGISFPTVPATGQQVTATFPPSFINQVIVSWRLPCVYMPNSYEIRYLDPNTNTFQLLEVRDTVGDSSCASFNGDVEIVSICIDYFPIVFTTQVQIRWDNVPVNLPPASPGAWIYEVAVHGLFQQDPYQIVSSLSAIGQREAAINVFLPILGLGITTFQGASVTPSTPLTATLRTEAGADATNLLLSPSGNPIPFSSGIFNNLILVSPPVGNYVLSIEGPGLRPVNLALTIVPGGLQSLLASVDTVSAIASATTPLPAIQICLADDVGNVIASGNSQLVTASSSTLTFVGQPAQATVQGCANLVLTLRAPTAALHTITFMVLQFQVSVELLITPGPPEQLLFVQPEFDFNNVVPLTLRARVADGAGNFVQSTMSGITAGLISLVPAPIVAPTGTNAAVIGNEVAFPSFLFRGVHNTSYVATFSASQQFADFSVTINIQPCSVAFPNSQAIADGTACECAPGFFPNPSTGGCLACPIGSFKPTAGADSCQVCPTGFDTFGETGLAVCYCDQQSFLDPESSTCQSCPNGAICGANQIIGNQAGFWRSGGELTNSINNNTSDLDNSGTRNTGFYNCHRARQDPSGVSQMGSLEACPSSLGFPTECGEGYEGVRCLACADNFGVSSTGQCERCPSQGQIWGAIVIALIFFLVFFTYFMYQGNQKAHKELVSAKILVDHFQTLGFFSLVSTVWAEPLVSILLFSAVATFIDSQLISTDCLNVSFGARFGFFMVVPWVVLVVSFVYHLILLPYRLWVEPKVYPTWQKFKWVLRIMCCFGCGIERPEARYKAPSSPEIRRQVAGNFFLSLLVFFFLSYPVITLRIFEVFDCSVEADGALYLSGEPSIECSSADHIPWLVWAILMFVLYVIGIPIALFFLLWKFQDSRYSTFSIPLQFLTSGYKTHRFFWELIIFGRKVLAAALIIAFRGDALFQLYGLTILIELALLLHLIFSPYNSNRQTRIELFSLTTLLASLFLSYYLAPEDQTSSPTAVGISIIIFLMQAFFALMVIWFLFRGFFRRHNREAYDQLEDKVSSLMHKEKKEQIDSAGFEKFLDAVREASESNRETMLRNLDEFWTTNPSYKQRRLITWLALITRGTKGMGFEDLRDQDDRDSEYGSIRGSINPVVRVDELPELYGSQMGLELDNLPAPIVNQAESISSSESYDSDLLGNWNSSDDDEDDELMVPPPRYETLLK